MLLRKGREGHIPRPPAKQEGQALPIGFLRAVQIPPAGLTSLHQPLFNRCLMAASLCPLSSPAEGVGLGQGPRGLAPCSTCEICQEGCGPWEGRGTHSSLQSYLGVCTWGVGFIPMSLPACARGHVASTYLHLHMK